jgi:5,10-methenyltetrahydrofolate synthetase
VAVRPTLIIVPCVGFDVRGYRLGYGGGFYDRTIAALQTGPGLPVRTVGVAWDEALLDDFTPLPTDLPLDAVVTPTAVFAARSTGVTGIR